MRVGLGEEVSVWSLLLWLLWLVCQTRGCDVWSEEPPPLKFKINSVVISSDDIPSSSNKCEIQSPMHEFVLRCSLDCCLIELKKKKKNDMFQTTSQLISFMIDPKYNTMASLQSIPSDLPIQKLELIRHSQRIIIEFPSLSQIITVMILDNIVSINEDLSSIMKCECCHWWSNQREYNLESSYHRRSSPASMTALKDSRNHDWHPPASPPTPNPTASKAPFDATGDTDDSNDGSGNGNGNNKGNNGSGSNSLNQSEIEMIAGIAVASALVVCCLACCLWVCYRRKKQQIKEEAERERRERRESKNRRRSEKQRRHSQSALLSVSDLSGPGHAMITRAADPDISPVLEMTDHEQQLIMDDDNGDHNDEYKQDNAHPTRHHNHQHRPPSKKNLHSSQSSRFRYLNPSQHTHSSETDSSMVLSHNEDDDDEDENRSSIEVVMPPTPPKEAVAVAQRSHWYGVTLEEQQAAEMQRRREEFAQESAASRRRIAEEECGSAMELVRQVTEVDEKEQKIDNVVELQDSDIEDDDLDDMDEDDEEQSASQIGGSFVRSAANFIVSALPSKGPISWGRSRTSAGSETGGTHEMEGDPALTSKARRSSLKTARTVAKSTVQSGGIHRTPPPPTPPTPAPRFGKRAKPFSRTAAGKRAAAQRSRNLRINTEKPRRMSGGTGLKIVVAGAEVASVDGNGDDAKDVKFSVHSLREGSATPTAGGTIRLISRDTEWRKRKKQRQTRSSSNDRLERGHQRSTVSTVTTTAAGTMTTTSSKTSTDTNNTTTIPLSAGAATAIDLLSQQSTAGAMSTLTTSRHTSEFADKTPSAMPAIERHIGGEDDEKMVLVESKRLVRLATAAAQARIRASSSLAKPSSAADKSDRRIKKKKKRRANSGPMPCTGEKSAIQKDESLHHKKKSSMKSSKQRQIWKKKPGSVGGTSTGGRLLFKKKSTMQRDLTKKEKKQKVQMTQPLKSTETVLKHHERKHHHSHHMGGDDDDDQPSSMLIYMPESTDSVACDPETAPSAATLTEETGTPHHLYYHEHRMSMLNESGQRRRDSAEIQRYRRIRHEAREDSLARRTQTTTAIKRKKSEMKMTKVKQKMVVGKKTSYSTSSVITAAAPAMVTAGGKSSSIMTLTKKKRKLKKRKSSSYARSERSSEHQSTLDDPTRYTTTITTAAASAAAASASYPASAAPRSTVFTGGPSPMAVAGGQPVYYAAASPTLPYQSPHAHHRPASLLHTGAPNPAALASAAMYPLAPIPYGTTYFATTAAAPGATTSMPAVYFPSQSLEPTTTATGTTTGRIGTSATTAIAEDSLGRRKSHERRSSLSKKKTHRTRRHGSLPRADVDSSGTVTYTRSQYRSAMSRGYRKDSTAMMERDDHYPHHHHQHHQHHRQTLIEDEEGRSERDGIVEKRSMKKKEVIMFDKKREGHHHSHHHHHHHSPRYSRSRAMVAGAMGSSNSSGSSSSESIGLLDSRDGDPTMTEDSGGFPTVGGTSAEQSTVKTRQLHSSAARAPVRSIHQLRGQIRDVLTPTGSRGSRKHWGSPLTQTPIVPLERMLSMGSSAPSDSLSDEDLNPAGRPHSDFFSRGRTVPRFDGFSDSTAFLE